MQNQELELDTKLWLVIANDISKWMHRTLIYIITFLVVQTQEFSLEIIGLLFQNIFNLSCYQVFSSCSIVASL